MRIPDTEREAIIAVIESGKRFGFGNLISHLQTAWARRLVEEEGFPEKVAREASGGSGYPFKMQDDLLLSGEWDETGKRYAATQTEKIPPPGPDAEKKA